MFYYIHIFKLYFSPLQEKRLTSVFDKPTAI